VASVALVVQKYGGSSVQDAERIKRVAERIVQTRKEGHDVVVVARPDVRELAEREGLAGVSRALDELVAKAGDGAAEAEPAR